MFIGLSVLAFLSILSRRLEWGGAFEIAFLAGVLVFGVLMIVFYHYDKNRKRKNNSASQDSSGQGGRGDDNIGQGGDNTDT